MDTKAVDLFVHQGTWWATVPLAFYTVKLFFKLYLNFNVHACFMHMQSISLAVVAEAR